MDKDIRYYLTYRNRKGTFVFDAVVKADKERILLGKYKDRVSPHKYEGKDEWKYDPSVPSEKVVVKINESDLKRIYEKHKANGVNFDYRGMLVPESQYIYVDCTSLLDDFGFSDDESIINALESRGRFVNEISFDFKNKIMNWVNKKETSKFANQRNVSKLNSKFIETKQIEEENKKLLDSINEMEGRVKKVENLPGNKQLNDMVSETAKDYLKEQLIEDFNKQYDDINNLRMTIKQLNNNWPHLATHSKLYPNYMRLSDEEKMYMFLPYLIEKKELGILTSKEREELESISFEKYGFNNCYYIGLALLQGFGLIDIMNENNFIRGFNKHNEIKLSDGNHFYSRNNIMVDGEKLKERYITPYMEDTSKPRL